MSSGSHWALKQSSTSSIYSTSWCLPNVKPKTKENRNLVLERKLQSPVEISVIFRGYEDYLQMRMVLKLQYGHACSHQWRYSWVFCCLSQTGQVWRGHHFSSSEKDGNDSLLKSLIYNLWQWNTFQELVMTDGGLIKKPVQGKLPWPTKYEIVYI